MIKILDCTLRDGGYINNWFFTKNKILYTIKKLNEANVDLIELGFLEDGFDNSDLNYSKYASMEQINELLYDFIPSNKYLIMIMHNKVDVSKIDDASQAKVKK